MIKEIFGLAKDSHKLVFDYVIIGTGPAGAVIAKTLSDDKRTSVLVLEAGENKDRDRPIKDSTFAPELEEMFFPQYFWQGEGVPQEGLDERSFEWTTGRLAGGGSSINGEHLYEMIGIRISLMISYFTEEQMIENDYILMKFIFQSISLSL